MEDVEVRHEGGFEPGGLKEQEGQSWASDAHASIQTDPRGVVSEFLEAELREGHPEMEMAAGTLEESFNLPHPPGTRRVGKSRALSCVKGV